ncbi:MAG: CPBP family intramembrane metalloprotease [Bacilli bacterium]|nr:CPBP family intramembrane metalloprotease [Bacilli bacterium]
MKKMKNKFATFFEKHFVKKRRDCKKCGKSVDAYVKRCPHCYERMGDNVLPARFQNMIFLTDYKLLLIFLVGTVGFILFSLLLVQGLNYVSMDANLLMVLENLIPSILVLSVFACILSYDIKDVLNSFKKTIYHIRPLIAALIGLAIIVAFSYAYQGIFNACGHPIVDSDNQTALVKMCQGWPALSFFFVVLLAPLMEELTYRLGLFTLLRKRNRYLAYVLTILIFALGHFNFTTKDVVNEFINLPLYIVPAFVLTALYEYEGVSSSVYTHVLNNLISFIVILTVR